MSAANTCEGKKRRRLQRTGHDAALRAIRDPYRFIVGWCSMLSGRRVTRFNREQRRHNLTHPKYGHMPSIAQRSHHLDAKRNK